MTSPDKASEPDLSGQILDRYHLLRRLGLGGMGAVYEAEHTRLRKRFAVKLLRHEMASNEISRKRFLREARAASAVSHPHVVAISDFGGTDDGHVFFVMELLEGRDLHDLLHAEHTLPWPRAREILLQVTSALQAAHQQEIIHRDIKPSNVFLADVPGKEHEDFVKVLDFGIAKISGNVGEITAKLTSTDEIFGTVAYMAPEMAVGKNDDPRSDMYAVGVMMFRMLTGKLPYTEGNAFQILSQHINAPIPSLCAEDPSIPESVEAIVHRAMAKQPEQRFATMEELNRVLRRGTLEATEVLVGMQALLQAERLEPMAARPGPDIDKTTPLPASSIVEGPTSSPSPHASPNSGTITRAGHLADELSSPASDPTDSAAIPLVEQTVESTPLVVELSGSTSEVPEAVTVAASAPIEVGSHAPILALETGRTAPTPSSDPIGRTVAALPESDELSDHEEPRRRFVALVLPIVGLAVAGVIALLSMNGQDESEGAKAPATAAVGPGQVERTAEKPEPAGQGSAPLEGQSSESPADNDAERANEPIPEVEPEDGYAEGVDDPVSEVEPKLPEPTTATSKPVSKRKPTTSKPKPPAKPKTDAEVVSDIKSRITSKCKGQVSSKVKVEGLISASGKVENLLVTPQGGLGSCEKVVKSAKFDPQGGVRPMPRFTVEL